MADLRWLLTCILCVACAGGAPGNETSRSEPGDPDEPLRLRKPCKSGAFQTKLPSRGVHVKVSDGARIGYCESLLQTGHAGTVFMLPGYTATAAQFVQWFAKPFASTGFKSIAMDYRGFGMSTGPWKASVGPDDVLYNGQDMARLAADAKEVIVHSGAERVVLFGHSIGVYFVLLLLKLFLPDMPTIAGIILLDTSPAHTKGPLPPARPSFNNSWLTRPFNTSGLMALTEFHADKVDCTCSTDPKTIKCHYPNTVSSYVSFFKAVTDAPQENQSQAGFMCYDDACLSEWSSATNCYSDINGMVKALQSFSDATLDFTATTSIVQDQTDFPIYIYAGENSLDPIEALDWSWTAMHNKKRAKDEYFKLAPPYGVHVPWLGQNSKKDAFYSSLTAWLTSIVA